MQALILNSGLGSRMGAMTIDKHKSMLEIADNLPLIVYQIETIASLGITNFVITTGYMQDKLKDLIFKRLGHKYSFKFVYNSTYDVTNYVYSIYLALDELYDDLILLHGDLYFTKSTLSRMLTEKKSMVVVDTTLPQPEKDFKARLHNNRVVQIATYINGVDCVACQPLYKLNRADWLVWADAIRKFCNDGKTDVYAEEALNTVLHSIDLRCFDLKGELCMEIDTPEDLALLKLRRKKGKNHE